MTNNLSIYFSVVSFTNLINIYNASVTYLYYHIYILWLLFEGFLSWQPSIVLINLQYQFQPERCNSKPKDIYIVSQLICVCCFNCQLKYSRSVITRLKCSVQR